MKIKPVTTRFWLSVVAILVLFSFVSTHQVSAKTTVTGSSVKQASVQIQKTQVLPSSAVAQASRRLYLPHSLWLMKRHPGRFVSNFRQSKKRQAFIQYARARGMVRKIGNNG